MVEVFKTNVQEEQDAKKIVQKLLEHFSDCQINFDLEDCDRILRVEGKSIEPEIIIGLLNSNGCSCEVLV